MGKAYLWVRNADYDAWDASNRIIDLSKPEAEIYDRETLAKKIMEAENETDMDKLFEERGSIGDYERVSCYIDDEKTRRLAWSQTSSWSNGDEYDSDYESFTLYISTEPKEGAVEMEI